MRKILKVENMQQNKEANKGKVRTKLLIQPKTCKGWVYLKN